MNLLRNSIFVLVAAASVSFAVPAIAAPGDTFILPIDHTQDGTFTDVPGGYNGDLTVQHTGQAGDIARVYWVVPNNVDPSPQLYKISWWASPGAENNAYQPIEVQYNGVAGDSSGIDPNIPWHGQFGTNHQYISNNYTTPSAFNLTGPGPQTPGDSSDTSTSSPTNPPDADGTSVWLKPGSELFVEWDFSFYSSPTTNTLSDLQITQVPEPASLSVLLLGAAGLMMRRRRNA
ncbi:MAG TPA: PEP-CTERM sorting domain-containing protein [Tepidisphaeraceae bacterium]|jgi:hypothetical protein|nr:PEP-CTERM sorting domain-containing protein [Tepidisphaeraceae bacterium]